RRGPNLISSYEKFPKSGSPAQWSGRSKPTKPRGQAGILALEPKHRLKIQPFEQPTTILTRLSTGPRKRRFERVIRSTMSILDLLQRAFKRSRSFLSAGS